jgi:LCP family protein required for cell wall assembly
VPGDDSSPLPPELDPRGRRRARPEQRERPASGRGAAGIDPGHPTSAVGGGHQTSGGAAGAGLTHGGLRQRGNGPGSVRRGVSVGVMTVAATLSLAILLGSGWSWATYRNFTTNLKRVNAIQHNTSAAQRNIDGTDQNVLIVGNDDRDTATDAELKQLGTTRDGGSYNTDTMMLMHVPADGSKATVISFPRDSYVAIPGHGMNKLNAAYPEGVADKKGDKAGGAQLLVQTIENLTGLSIDHFVQVDLLGFYRISNAIGGVTVCLNAAMGPAKSVGEVGPGLDSGYENGVFVKSYSGIDLKKGNNVIKGKQALAFVRQRHGLPNGDLDRIKRQQYFLSAVFRKLVSAGVLLNPFKLQSLLKAVTTSLITDESLDPLRLAQQMQNLQAGNVRFTTIPTTGFDDNSPVGSVVVVDTAAMPDFIDNLLGADAASALKNAKTVNAGSFTVDVENASGVSQRASRNAAALKAVGFHTALPSVDPAPLANTTIRYPKGMEGAAKTLAAQIPGASVVRSGAVKNVTLLLGKNGVQVKSLTPAASPKPTAPKPSASSTTGPVVTTAADAGCIN